MNSEWCDSLSMSWLVSGVSWKVCCFVVNKTNSGQYELWSLVPCGQWSEQWTMWVVKSALLWSTKGTVGNMNWKVCCFVVNKMNSGHYEFESLLLHGQWNEQWTIWVVKSDGLWSMKWTVSKMSCKVLVLCGQWNEQWAIWVGQSGVLWSMKRTVDNMSFNVWCFVVKEMNSEQDEL